jgi:hypothetical protein
MLSNEEQRQLDEIERALRDDDPSFAATVDFGHLRRRRIIAPGATILLGLVLLVVGEIAAQSLMIAGVILSVAGFLVTVGGFWWLFRGVHSPG